MANNTNLSFPPAFYQQFFKDGKPLSSGKLYTYIAGSSTSVVTYKTISGGTESANMNTNPIILDMAGMAKLVISKDTAYKFVLFDRNDVKVDEWDNVTACGSEGGVSSEEIVVDGTTDEINVSSNVTQGVKHYVVSLSNTIKSAILRLLGLYENVAISLEGKADKVQGAMTGNLAALDAEGNLTDSGSKVGDFKTKQTAVTDPSASGTGLEFISSVSQNANGEMTANKKSVQDGTTAQKGVVKLNNAIDSSSTTEAATPKAVKDAYDALNNKIIARATFLSQAEWSVQSQLPGDPAKVYYVENGTGEDAYTVYVWNTATNTYVEVDESSIDLDGYWHDSPVTTGNGNVVTSITLGNDGVPQIVKGITALTQHQDISGKLDKNGDASNTTATFTIANSRTNISSGEKLSTIFGKIAKWFSDLKALAFKDNVSDSDISGTIADAHIASASTWNHKQDALPTTGTPSSTFAINVSGTANDIVYDKLSANATNSNVYQVIGKSPDRGTAGRTTTLLITDGDIGGLQGTYLVSFSYRSEPNVKAVSLLTPSNINKKMKFGYYVNGDYCYLVASKPSWTSSSRIHVLEKDENFVIELGDNTGTMPSGYTDGTNIVSCNVQAQVGSSRLPIYVNDNGTFNPINIDEYYCWAQPTTQWTDIMELTVWYVQNQCNNEILGSTRSTNLNSSHPSLCYLHVKLPELQGAGRYRFTLEFEITNSNGQNLTESYGVLILDPPTGYSGESFLAECVYDSNGKAQSSVMNQIHVPPQGSTYRHKLYVDGHTYRVVKTK